MLNEQQLANVQAAIKQIKQIAKENSVSEEVVCAAIGNVSGLATSAFITDLVDRAFNNFGGKAPQFLEVDVDDETGAVSVPNPKPEKKKAAV